MKNGNETNVAETIPVSGIVELPEELPAVIEVPESSVTVEMPEAPRGDTVIIDVPTRQEVEQKIRKKKKVRIKRTGPKELDIKEGEESNWNDWPSRIRVAAEMKPFDIGEFLRSVKMDSCSLADVLWVSPYLRKKLMREMRILPREKRLALLNEYPKLEEEIEHPERFLGMFQRILEVSKFPTHRIRGAMAGTSTLGMLDGGACANCISEDFVKKTATPIRGRTTNDRFSQIGGGPAPVIGEVHECVFTIGTISVPFSAIVVNGMKGDIILGRPFLEKTKTHVVYADGRSFLQWQGKLAVVETATTGIAIVLPLKRSVYWYMEHWTEISERMDEDMYDVSGDSGESDESDDADDEDEEEEASDGDDSDTEGRINILMSEDEITREEFAQMLENDEVLYATLLRPTSTGLPEDELIDYARMLGIVMKGDEHATLSETDDSEDDIDFAKNEIIMNEDHFGINVKYETGVAEPTPLKELEHPALDGRHVMIGDLPELKPYMDKIEAFFVEFHERFIKDGDQLQPFSNVPEIRYKLKPGTSSYPRARWKRWSEQEAAVLLEYKKKNANYLEPSNSPSSCMPLLVKKKDGKWRVVVNFIPVNKIVTPFAWPLQGMDMSYRKLLWAIWFSFWDFCSGYHQSPLAAEWRWLTATAFPDGSLMQWMVGPQGFIDTGQWFTYHVHLICDDPLLKKYISHYVDDGHAGTTTIDEHFVILRRFFEKLTYHTASLSGPKSGFFVKVFKLLGLIITHGKVYADTTKLKKCKGFKTPMTPSEMKGFIHFVGFYQMKIPEFPKLSSVLHEIVKLARGKTDKYKELWKSGQKYKEAYKLLKRAMLSAKVITQWDRKRHVILATDASENVIAYILAHPEDPSCEKIDTNVIYVPILFGGRSMAGAETRYTTLEKEVLAVFEGVRKFHHYVRDHTLHVFTDHSALLSYANGISINKRIVKWMTYLADYDIEWHHRKREMATDADGLTRLRWNHDPMKDVDDVLDEGIEGYRLSDAEVNDSYLLSLLTKEDHLYVGLKKFLSGESLNDFDERFRRRIRLSAVKYFLVDNVLYRRTVNRPRVYVPLEEREKVMEEFHGGKTFSHGGVTTTFRLMRLRVFWPTMYADLAHHIRDCHACQSFGKRPRTKYQLIRIPPPMTFGYMLGMDYVDGLPGQFPHMFSLIDYSTSWAESWPTTKSNADTTIRKLEEWRHRYGPPYVIITDNAKYFHATELQAYAIKHGITLNYASSAYAKSNGKVERYQGVIEGMVAKEIKALGADGKQWHTFLPKALWSWRTQPKEQLGVSPYVAVFGQEPRFLEQISGYNLDELKYDVDELEAILLGGKDAFTKAVRDDANRRQIEMQKAVEQLPSPKEYQPGELVYLWDKRKDDQHGRKLDPIWKGPYFIKAAHSNGSYTLEQLNGRIVGNGITYNHSHLKKAYNGESLLGTDLALLKKEWIMDEEYTGPPLGPVC